MKPEQINSLEDLKIYIEGIINDYTEHGVSGKEETIFYIAQLCNHLVGRKKNVIGDIVKKSMDKMEEDGTFERINRDGELFEEKKMQIYKDITAEAHFMMENGYDYELEKFLDRFGVIPDEELLKKYR